MKLENLKIQPDFVMSEFSTGLKSFGVGDLPSNSKIVFFKIPSFMSGITTLFTVHEIINRVYKEAQIPLLNCAIHFQDNTTEWYISNEMPIVETRSIVNYHLKQILIVLYKNTNAFLFQLKNS